VRAAGQHRLWLRHRFWASPCCKPFLGRLGWAFSGGFCAQRLPETAVLNAETLFYAPCLPLRKTLVTCCSAATCFHHTTRCLPYRRWLEDGRLLPARHFGLRWRRQPSIFSPAAHSLSWTLMREALPSAFASRCYCTSPLLPLLLILPLSAFYTGFVTTGCLSSGGWTVLLWDGTPRWPSQRPGARCFSMQLLACCLLGQVGLHRGRTSVQFSDILWMRGLFMLSRFLLVSRGWSTAAFSKLLLDSGRLNADFCSGRWFSHWLCVAPWMRKTERLAA